MMHLIVIHDIIINNQGRFKALRFQLISRLVFHCNLLQTLTGGSPVNSTIDVIQEDLI